MVLALLEAENQRRLARQAAMYAQDTPLWRRYEQACDYLEEDLESGYVRILQEMIAAGWSTPEIGAAAREMVKGWFDLLTEVAVEAADRRWARPVLARRSGRLVVNAFFGAEALILLGFDRPPMPIRASLRRVGELIRSAEERAAASAGGGGCAQANRGLTATSNATASRAPFEILVKNVNAVGDPAVTVSSFPAQNAIKTPNTRMSRAAHVQARRTVPTSICPVKVEESHQT